MPESFERDAIGRLRLHVLPTKRFKTFAVSLYAGVPLTETGVTKTALTPFVLRRGTQSYPETIAFREKLDELYGAGFAFDLYKRGDYQVVQFRLDVINDQFVATDQSLLQAALQMLGEVVTKPSLEDGRFRSRYVDAEKATVTKQIEAVINDKIRYAAQRCVEEMCKDEPYRLSALGRKDELPAIDADQLYQHYRNWLSQACFDLYVSGDTSLAEVREYAAKAFRLPEGSAACYAPAALRPARERPQTIVERLDVNQGKLNLGLRTGVAFGSPDYYSLMVYNGLLGAFPHAKLFVNVREKASLAYYASSRLDGHKGLLTIQSGIEIANFERTLNIIQEQLEAMKRADFTADDVTRTKAMLGNQLREVRDSAFERIGFDFNGVLAGETGTADDWIRAIEAVTPEQVATTAKEVALDTIYFLRDRQSQTTAKEVG